MLLHRVISRSTIRRLCVQYTFPGRRRCRRRRHRKTADKELDSVHRECLGLPDASSDRLLISRYHPVGESPRRRRRPLSLETGPCPSTCYHNARQIIQSANGVSSHDNGICKHPVVPGSTPPVIEESIAACKLTEIVLRRHGHVTEHVAVTLSRFVPGCCHPARVTSRHRPATAAADVGGDKIYQLNRPVELLVAFLTTHRSIRRPPCTLLTENLNAHATLIISVVT